MKRTIRINYREIALEQGSPLESAKQLPSLQDAVCTTAHANEHKTIRYLENGPNYSAMGKVVRDVFDPENGAILFPGTNTDGVFLWPIELAYYVRKYHVRLPSDFLERMASRDWQPPSKSEINFESLYAGFAT
ncbi:MAG: hypothetical protein JWO87_884 [Phycisphaerales bacterium]|nr:hypothetical protein [Phycisphaerales bacterium]